MAKKVIKMVKLQVPAGKANPAPLIGANSVVLNEVPPNSTVVGIPGRIVKQDGKRLDRLSHNQVSDPIIDQFRQMQEQIDRLKKELSIVQEQQQTKEGV